MSVFVSSDGAQTWSELTGPGLDWAKAVFSAAPGTPAAAIEAAAAFLAGFNGAMTDASGSTHVGDGLLAILGRSGHRPQRSVGTLHADRSRVSTSRRTRALPGARPASGMTDSAVQSVLVDPVSPSTIYATNSASIVKSTDGGLSWLRSSRAADP